MTKGKHGKKDEAAIASNFNDVSNDNKSVSDISEAPLIVESDQPLGTFVETSLDDLVKKARSAHMEIAPVFLEHEQGGFLIIRHTHGFYALAEHLDGGVLLLYAHDYACFDPLVHADKAFRENNAPGFWIDPAQSRHIEIVAARDSRDGEKWVMAEINRHNYYKMQDLERFGYLWRPSEGLFESGAVIYKIEPGHKTDHRLVRCYTTEGKEREFTETGLVFLLREGLKKGWGRLFPAGSITALLPADTKIRDIMDDFVKRSSLIDRGIDPSRLGYLLNEPKLKSRISPGGRGLIARLGLGVLVKVGLGRFFQAMYTQLAYGKTSNNILEAAKTFTLAAGHFIMRGAVAGVLTMAIAIIRPVGQAYMRIFMRPPLQSLFHSGKNISERYGCPDHLAVSGDGYFHRLDKEHAFLCRFLHPDETDPYPFSNFVRRKKVRTDFAAHKLLDPYGAPAGTEFEMRRINKMNTLRIMQPDGIEIYLLLGKRVGYARYRQDMENSFARPMPRKMRALFKDSGEYLRVFVHKGTVRVESLDKNQFVAGLNAETRIATRDEAYPEPLYSIQALQKEWQQAAPAAEAGQQKVRRTALNGMISACSYVGKKTASAVKDTHEASYLSTKMADAVKGVIRNAANAGEEWAAGLLKEYEDERARETMKRQTLERIMRRKIRPENN